MADNTLLYVYFGARINQNWLAGRRSRQNSSSGSGSGRRDDQKDGKDHD